VSVKIKVYPNPASNRIIIEGKPEIQNYQIKVLNIMGESILVTKNRNIDISTLSNGIYFVNFETEQFISSKKIIVQH